MRFKWKPLTAEVGMIASQPAPTNEIVNVPLGSKEKGEVRNPASGKGYMGNSTIDDFLNRLGVST